MHEVKIKLSNVLDFASKDEKSTQKKRPCCLTTCGLGRCVSYEKSSRDKITAKFKKNKKKRKFCI